MPVMRSIIMLIALVIPQLLLATQSPIPMLTSIADNIIATLQANKANLKTNPSIIHQAVRQHLLSHVDIAGMSRSVLGREIWSRATAQEKQQFASAFTKLVIRTYSNPLAEYSNETIKFLPLREPLTGRFLRVNSIIIRSSAHNIPLSYSLVAINGAWKIYDLSIEGVSLLQSFRSQFAAALHNSNIAEIINQLNQQSMKKAG